MSSKYKKIIGLSSIDGNELVDYTLKNSNFLLSNYPNNMNLALQLKEEVYKDS